MLKTNVFCSDSLNKALKIIFKNYFEAYLAKKFLEYYWL